MIGGDCMVEIINTWAQKIIIVIIICTIIEMLLPQGKNKKYIKTVIGIYVVFTIISPILSSINNNSLDLSKYLILGNNQTIETSTNLDTNEYIEEIYIEKIKSDIKTKLKTFNYSVKKIELEIENQDDKTYGTILKICLALETQVEEKNQNDIKIEKIVIGEEKIKTSSISNEEKNKIKQYLAGVYCINAEKIYIY